MAANHFPVQPSLLRDPPTDPIAHHHNLRHATRTPTGSGTQTITSAPASRTPSPPLVLRLRGAHHHHDSPQPQQNDDIIPTIHPDRPHRHRQPRIQWASDVIDNEGLGRKKSKVCCIYHKPRAVGESSDESSSSSDNDSGSDKNSSDEESDRARPSRKLAHGKGKGKKKVSRRRQPSPNAYEKMPHYDVEPLTEQPGHEKMNK